ncbi:hypothetical protein N7468_008893 [Penicillium chermesinum]|uniref:Uncharacterized protein n=1 Tax=Penicillium chermesinum TaxID=63820 RepID=A0A9W9NGS6_9EURO|nr:uncharacterized protein N7468_008893 [Penicillium chermesinum]KAJ5219689.1 hypothetical protein N7468_008893 [Penicillium chermesinum]KAJ6153689.1 hypothetical protein N7470_006648 [Penicillium chermesinum]
MRDTKYFIVINFILSALLISLVNALYDCPRPRCETCLPVAIHDAPGVGFDLTPSYGTAVVHYYNGTVVEVGKVAGNSHYLKLMEDLAKPSQSLHQTTSFSETLLLHLEELLPVSNVLPSWKDLWRWLKERLGWEVNAEVQILRDLINDLKQATEKATSQSLDRVAVTAPDMPSLRSETITSALKELNLRTWVGDSPSYTNKLVEADTVYAANGYGLCRNYQDLFECSDEFEDSSTPRVYLVSFSRHLLYTSIIRPTNGEALATYTSDRTQVFDFDIGLDRIEQAEPSDHSLWDQLRRDLLVLPREAAGPITHVLLAGESATDARFLAILRDSLAGVLLTPSSDHQITIGHSKSQINRETIIDPTFAAARGAALYARRRQEVQSECTESAKCEKERAKERSHRHETNTLADR